MEMGMGRSPYVLVVDHDPAMQTYLRRSLAAENYRVCACASLQEALGNLADRPPNLVILDLDLAAGGGSDLIRLIREISLVPILAISVHSNEQFIVDTLKSGADDFVAKPFGIRELVARAESALRRAIRQKGSSSRFISGDLEVDLLHRRVRSRGRDVHLSPKAYDVLSVLAEGPGRVHKHKEILNRVRGPNRTDRLPYLRYAIREIRRAIEADPAHPIHILTETRIGYRLRAEDRQSKYSPALRALQGEMDERGSRRAR
jgi:two-component system KDP operon response regulator KdpE